MYGHDPCYVGFATEGESYRLLRTQDSALLKFLIASKQEVLVVKWTGRLSFSNRKSSSVKNSNSDRKPIRAGVGAATSMLGTAVLAWKLTVHNKDAPLAVNLIAKRVLQVNMDAKK